MTFIHIYLDLLWCQESSITNSNRCYFFHTYSWKVRNYFNFWHRLKTKHTHSGPSTPSHNNLQLTEDTKYLGLFRGNYRKFRNKNKLNNTQCLLYFPFPKYILKCPVSKREGKTSSFMKPIYSLVWVWSGSYKVHPASGRVNPSFPEFLCVQDFLPLQSFAALITQHYCNTIHKAILL